MNAPRGLIWLIENYATALANLRVREFEDRYDPDAHVGFGRTPTTLMMESKCKEVMGEIEEYLAEHFMLKPEIPGPTLLDEGCM